MVVTLALAGWASRPQAGPVSPDPADCFFTPISSKVSTGKFPKGLSVVALSGDGQTALLRTHFDSFDEPIIMLDEEFFFSNRTRTLLTHFDSSQHNGGPVIQTSGPRWTSVDLPFDGSFVATTRTGKDGPQVQLLSLPEVNASALLLTSAIRVSGDGAWIIGRDSEGQLVRYRRADHRINVLEELPGAPGAQVFSVSYTGDTVCGLHDKLGARVAFRWVANKGLSEPPLPEGFIPSSADASGEIFAGRISQTVRFLPACWSERGGLVQMGTTLNGVDAGRGQVALISGNGQFLFGTLGDPTFPVASVVWTRDGSVYELASLIRGVDFGGQVISRVDAVSHDGRTIGGVCYTPANRAPSFFLAGLALPGEGPHIALQPTAAGGRTLNFHAKNGFHYRVQGSTSLGDWSAASLPEITGDDADHAVASPAGSEVASFFRLVVTP